MGLHKVSIVFKYKHLGTLLGDQILADSAGKGLGSVISECKQFKDCDYRTY